MADYFRKFFAKLSLQRLEGSLDKDLQVCDEVSINSGGKDIEMATNNRSEANFLGKGSFGIVYRGKLKDTIVAIKFLKPEFAAVIKKELSSLVRFQHENLIRLYGYNRKNVCLVLEFAALGPLRNSLEATEADEILTATQRIDIILGTAKGLEYLHTAFSKALVHRDISSGNVLLDKNRKAKISDFGLARSVQVIERESICATAFKACGTHGYMPPEAKYGVVSRKYDVYGFGVLVLEIISILLPYSTKRSPHMLSDIYFQKKERKLPFPSDKKIKWPAKCVSGLLEIAEKCLHIKSNRPYIDEIREDLEVFIKHLDVDKLSKDSSTTSFTQQDENKNLKKVIVLKDDTVNIRPTKPSSKKQRRPASAPVTAKNINIDAKPPEKSQLKIFFIDDQISTKVQDKSPTDEAKTVKEKNAINKNSAKVQDKASTNDTKSAGQTSPMTPGESPDLALYTTDV
ncbi:uncharacterized protein TRIADDRAFT_56774 [Trichoplax adhaerens]|uniref:Protein kinase domain-containing protein n=1 Tax=Trichoplax adhaerens TaxID=10228 RepID=B3RWJ7_TRIAD|nr:hypothetical protein TRIADDRAFT_56774 [Trichoplax adhaerens]EDV24704.1 hypothetical protein TRIADDRAFT_56774 [Trichoplax adhaerens]|eukprot:XP_002112594.1 hypothetical protein TRIADDRAFT_56774 [Trichoplax adhaerens]